MKPIVLFRADRFSLDELEVCRKFFPVVESRMQVPENSLVIGRYSVLPYYHELNRDLISVKSKLINNTREHTFIANFDWYWPLREIDITPRTWFDTTEAARAFDSLPHGMILKGRTNSAKCWEWMYAGTKKDFYRIDNYLHQHEWLAQQGIVYREYVPLEIIEKSVIPGTHNFVNEWRCFFYKRNLLNFGYYWSCASEEAITRANNQELYKMLDAAQTAADVLAESTNFFVVDVAKTASGNWIVIEINDGQMSGLSECKPELLYQNLKFQLESERSEP